MRQNMTVYLRMLHGKGHRTIHIHKAVASHKRNVNTNRINDIGGVISDKRTSFFLKLSPGHNQIQPAVTDDIRNRQGIGQYRDVLLQTQQLRQLQTGAAWIHVDNGIILDKFQCLTGYQLFFQRMLLQLYIKGQLIIGIANDCTSMLLCQHAAFLQHLEILTYRFRCHIQLPGELSDPYSAFSQNSLIQRVSSGFTCFRHVASPPLHMVSVRFFLPIVNLISQFSKKRSIKNWF